MGTAERRPVLADIPEEFRPLVKGGIRATRHQSRTEAFMLLLPAARCGRY
jgi:hypothetical protein